MLSHAEVNARFVALDSHPALLSTTFEGWLAWPIVKERLWLLCLEPSGDSSRSRVQADDAVRRIASGIRQVASHLTRPVAADLGLFYEPRSVEMPDGRLIHPHLGDIAAIERVRPLLRFHYVWGQRAAHRRRHGTLDDLGVGAVVAAAAKAVRAMPSLAKVAGRLVEAVEGSFPEVARRQLYSAAADQLARFRVRFWFLRRLFEASKVRSVVVLDWDGKVAEVAAGKAVGARVTEVQHGMFSTDEPDYSWTAAHRDVANFMPIPDRVVVFGPFWARQLAVAGYWRPGEIVEAINPVLGPYRQERADTYQRRPDRPLIVLFPTQPYVREAALKLFGTALEAQASGCGYSRKPQFRLRVKVHPLERQHTEAYAALARLHPDTCEIVGNERDAFAEMLKVDVVAGYTSLMLLEAVALGIPVLSLRGGSAPEGFCDTFGTGEIRDALLDCDDAPSLLAHLVRLDDVETYTRMSRSVREHASLVYTFDGATVEEIIADA